MPVQIDLSKKYLAQAQYVAAFARDSDVRLKQPIIEKAFRPLFGGNQSVQTNMPDEFSGRAPRIMFNAKSKNLAISQMAMTLSLRFEQSEGAVSKELDIVEKNIRDLERALPLFQEMSSLREVGLVLAVNYPSGLPVAELCEHLYGRFFSFHPLGQVVTSQMTLGFRMDSQHYLNFSCSAYEKHQGDSLAAINPAGDIIMDPQELPVVEHGIEVKIDINDRPRVEANADMKARNVPLLIERARNMIANDLDTILGFV